MTGSCRPLLAALLLLLLATFPARAVRPEIPFHPPGTEAERALDAAVRVKVVVALAL